MTDNTLADKFWRYVGQTSPFPPSLEVDRAEGSWLFDAGGRRYLDFISGIAVTNVGHCHPHVTRAVQHQVSRYAHTMVYGEHIQGPQVRLAEKIVTVAPAGLDCVYFLTTGAETNDAALKLAVKQTGRRRFVAFRHAYHGDTAAALSCFGSAHFRDQFPGLLADVVFLPFGDEAALSAIDETIAAVLIEPVQGEGGIQVPGAEYLREIRRRCNETGALLIFDEVQTGFGRTGEWFASVTFGVTPDLITMAKGMGAGYPLAGILAPRQMLYNFAAEPAFSHITTFGGHPVSCAAGLAAMEVIEQENLLENCRAQGAWLLEQGRELAVERPQSVKEARGIGLMIGVEMRDQELARKVIEACREDGLIVESNLLNEAVIRLSPPLNVSREECEYAMERIRRAVEQLGTE